MDYYLDEQSIQILKFLFVSEYQENICISYTDGDSFFNTMIPATAEGIDDRFYFPLNSAFGYYVQNHCFRYFDYHRRNNNLFGLRNLVIDIDKDNHNDYSEHDEFDKLALAEALDSALSPTLIVITGGGLQLWFHIHEKSIVLKDYYLEAVHNAFDKVNRLLAGSGYSADKRTEQLSKLFRLPGSIHQKRQCKCSIYSFREKTFDFKDFGVTGYLAFEEKENKSIVKKSRSKKVDVDKDLVSISELTAFNNLHKYRIRFIESAVNHNFITEGNREYCLWLYHNCFNSLQQTSLIEKLNLKIGLSDSEIKAIKKETKVYKVTQSKFYEYLGLSDSEIDEIKKEIDLKYKEKSSKKLLKELRNQKILELSDSGLTIREICSILHVGQHRVLKVLNS